MNTERIRRALDKLKHAGPDARVHEVIDADELAEMKDFFAPVRAKRMTPRAPTEADTACDVVGRYERDQ